MMNVIFDNRVSVSVIKCATSGLTLTISTGNRLSANSGATGITVIRIMEIATKALRNILVRILSLYDVRMKCIHPIPAKMTRMTYSVSIPTVICE